MFLEDVSRHEKLLLCGDFSYWLDTPASKPYTEEFVGLLNANDIKNFVMMPTHVSGHTLDLVLAPTESDFVGSIEISPIDSDITDHTLLTFMLCFSRPPTYRKTITFRNYNGLDANVAAIIETDLVDAVARGQTSVQCTNSYNEVLSSARDQFCPLVTKDIIIKDDAPWYDHRMVSLRRQRRRAERVWRRLRTDSSGTVYVAARRAVVKQIFFCKVEYYQHQLALTAGDHRHTFQLLNDLLGKVQCSTMPSSSSEIELAAHFSAFFNAKIDRIRSEIDVSVAGQEFSIDVSFDLDIASTFSHFRPINETDVFRYMKETKKTCCTLDPINVSKLWPVYKSAAPAVVAIINSSFTEGSFWVSEKRGLVRPHLKKDWLNVEDLANYCPVTNLPYLSKMEERAMLEQLVPFLEEAGVIPHCQTAYRRFHSTETALCKIYIDLVHTICLGRASLLVLLDLSAAFDTVDHQLLLNDFYNSGVRDVALNLLKSYISGREQRVAVGEAQPEPMFLHCGVPQGSVLGPLLFTVV